jgi:hypothetical protein
MEYNSILIYKQYGIQLHIWAIPAHGPGLRVKAIRSLDLVELHAWGWSWASPGSGSHLVPRSLHSARGRSAFRPGGCRVRRTIIPLIPIASRSLKLW